MINLKKIFSFDALNGNNQCSKVHCYYFRKAINTFNLHCKLTFADVNLHAQWALVLGSIKGNRLNFISFFL
jgi:hypothetical protein